VERDGDDARLQGDAGMWQRLPGATPVSLNFWGFTPEVLAALAEGFHRFLAQNATSLTAEYYLLSPVQALIDERKARVRVLGGGGPWAGLTYPGDRPRLVELLATLTRQGVYPADLWA
jgi:hypothetical protein